MKELGLEMDGVAADTELSLRTGRPGNNRESESDIMHGGIEYIKS